LYLPKDFPLDGYEWIGMGQFHTQMASQLLIGVLDIKVMYWKEGQPVVYLKIKIRNVQIEILKIITKW
tara:strand:+ start:371 stop:574 length:204 start_codon:yes stop_codon:yes gene_type:complete